MFCHNCGADAGTAKFCPNCGTRIVMQDAAAERGTGTLTLRKYRSERMRDLSADIYLDGDFNTVITGSDSLTITVPAGEHELLIHADGCVDAIQKVQVDALENRLCIFSVDDVGFIIIVQQGSVSRSASYPENRGHSSWAAGGAAVAYQPAEEQVSRGIPETQTDDEEYAADTTDRDTAGATYTAPENTKFCKFCGSLIHEESVVCPHCGRQVEELHRADPKVIEHHTTTIMHGKPKDKWTAFLLCLFLGVLGIHKFYEEKVGMGILYLFTGGLFGIGWLIDLISIAMKPNPYYV